MNPIYNIEMWENLIAVLLDNPESPYLCDNSTEFKGLWDGGGKGEIMKIGKKFLEDSDEINEGWYIDDFYLFLSIGIDEQELATGENMDQYRIAIRLEFCKYMLNKSKEYELHQTES